ncbi:hypothetical protein SUGI_0815910 [Cryptomeria japonica]|nr:hypothetical protein SUGI_0815910 [Cryptomeria japonica]
MQEVLDEYHFMTSKVVKLILGNQFLRTDHKYKVNTKIPTIFLATLLHFGLSKDKLEMLVKKVFKSDLLGGLDQALRNIDENLTIPLPIDYGVTLKNERQPPRFPILYIEDESTFKYISFTVERNANFLWKLFKMSKTEDKEWIRSFLDCHGFSQFASEEKLQEWNEDLKAIWSIGGEDPETEAECFPMPKQDESPYHSQRCPSFPPSRFLFICWLIYLYRFRVVFG